MPKWNRDGDLLTTGYIAKICRVSQTTVCKWIDRGLLPAFRIPGSTQRRVTRENMVEFMLASGLPAEWIEQVKGS